MTQERYERLAAIDWWDAEKVRHARALVVGAGALGNEVVKNLVLSGWGTIFIVDHDSIELSNLTRSVFFRESDVGAWKAEVLAKQAQEANRDCQLIGLVGDARLMLSAGMVRRSDVVLGCVDNLAARVALSQLVGQAGGVMIDGGLSTWEGTVQIFGPDFTGPCYACNLTEDDLRELNLRQSCLAYALRAAEEGGVPTTPTVASVTAALMVQEALKWIHRHSGQLPAGLGRETRVDLANNRFWNHALPVNDGCVLHPVSVSPAVREQPRWDSSWREIVQQCQLVAGAAAAPVQIPARILSRRECLACGTVSDKTLAYAGDGRVPCQGCGEDAIPTFTTVVDGTEDWADRTPADLGFPPWTWISLGTETGSHTVELAGTRAPYDTLGGR